MDFTLYIKQFIVDFIQILNEMSPYLLLGFLFAGILKVAIPQKFIDKYMGQKNSRSVLNAALLGIPMPLCSCGVIPTGISFYKSGASKGSTVSFLISTPQTGVDSILVTYSLLGLPFAIIRPIIALVTGYVGGMLANSFDKKEEKIEEKILSEVKNCDTNSKEGCGCGDSCGTQVDEKHSKLYTMFKYAFVDFLQDISKWLVIGLLLAAVISVALPDDFFASYIGNDFVGMLIILVASVPLYICATSSVPVAAILLMKGVSPGAALVFLMAGPATNAATITVLNKVLGKKTSFAYLISIIMGALVFGLLIDHTLPREWFTLKGLHATMGAHDGHFSLPLWLQWGSSISLTLLIINGYIQKTILKRKITDDTTLVDKTDKHLISVLGMSCNHCKNSVEKHIGALKNINSAKVNLEQKQLRISGNKIELEIIQKELESLGFEYGGEIDS
ncbi:SO_0444 family Cu/Zn efflux transporter [Ancylomarina sp. 16SWW S1-10-2]|uniref:SO_0444 family Cu/Zn efflux transporter n=1 Tax=Ancylomarina sp. 16SWW S1-10-2 TaxID=2499681 RepID=UPI0012AE0016|nr:SO_0444 family Cu/Zn efflux transporter [Ancylomarina sp. 16SWW S1-10-2]MRT94397.1 heavy metal-associated domain-containing protein [Ancylomarina sp. 16SWW S1-10-2]